MSVRTEQGVPGALERAVSTLVNRSITSLQDVRRDPLDYDAFLAHRVVHRLHGIAVTDGDRVPWSLIEKRTEGPGLASPYLLDNASREFNAYMSGILDDLAPNVRAPRLYGSQLTVDGSITLWLEEIDRQGPRPLNAQTILAAARDLGGLSGRWYGRDLSEPWMFREWIERHTQSGAIGQGLATLRRRHPHAIRRLQDRLGLAEQLILNQPRFRGILESLPQTLCHHDAVGANVFRTDGQTVLIDWESLGPGPMGADLASLLFSSVRRGDASITVVLQLVKDALHAYAEGVWEEQPQIRLEDLRRGFEAASALRWKLAVDVVAGIEQGKAPRRGSLPDEAPEAALEELIQLVDLTLAAAQHVLDGA